MGVVYLALTALGEPVALKVVRPELGDDPEFRARFQREIAATRRVSGRYIAQVVDADPEASPPWLATAYVAGPSLAQAVATHGPLPVPKALSLVSGVADALAAIHVTGVIHRDLKPSNVLLAEDGPRVIDFGIARAAGSAAVTRTGVRLGSTRFMPPEQARGDEVTPAADVWALGALACFAATGRPPFGGRSEVEVLYQMLQGDPDLGGCPAELTGVIWACLAKDPAARPSLEQVMQWCRAEASAGAVPCPPRPRRGSRPSCPAAGTRSPGPSAPGRRWPRPFRPAARLLPSLWPGPRRPGRHRPAARSLLLLLPPPPPPPPPPLPLPAAIPAPGGPARGFSRHAAIAAIAAAVVLVGLAAYGVVALTNRGHTSHNITDPGQHGPSHRPRPTPKASASASPKPSPSSTLDQCLIGTWRQTLEQLPDTLDGIPVTLSGGSGVIQVFTAAGVNTLQYSNATYTAQENGNSWTQVENGTATVNYTTQDGMLLSSDLVQSGTWTLYENGAFSNSGPLAENIEPDRYVCSGNSLQLFATNGDSIDLTRTS